MSGLLHFLNRTLLCILAVARVAAHATDPITTRSDEVGNLLNQWAAQGSAAGLQAITYENRDNQHSPLPLNLWPGLKARTLTSQDKAAGINQGPAQILRESPTFGNCSMAAPADRGGSLARFYFMDPGGNSFLAKQYLTNQIFIYPEHQDHDPGGNGLGGWGDLFPLNSPAILITQGSSGSDQPLLQALFSTTAAFPPDTQRLLISNRLLAPTLQHLLRRHNRVVQTDQDYLSGKAHPVVFDSTFLDEKKMVLAANAMTPGAIPPVCLLEVLEETKFLPGTHFFEPENPHPHELSTTPVSIARIFRGNTPEYRIVVSAQKSGDLKNRPLKLRMAILQGDPKLIRLETANDQPVFRLGIRWHPPTATTRPGERIRSHRVDIAFFADNGVTISPPSILSVLMLPNERRYYDDQGRIAEISYLARNPDLGLPADDADPRWIQVIKACILRADGLRSTLMERSFEPEERASLNVAYSKLSVHQQRLAALENDPARKEDATRRRALLQDTLRTTLNSPLPGSRKQPARQIIEAAFLAIAKFTDLYLSFQADLDTLAAQSPKNDAAAVLQNELQLLIDWGVLIRQSSGLITPLHTAEERTEAENDCLKALNLTLLSHVLYPDALQRQPGPAWVDPRLTTRKAWRDVYRYDPDSGQPLGWIRHQAGRTVWFNAKGELLPDGPASGTPSKPVTYLPDPATGLRFELAK